MNERIKDLMINSGAYDHYEVNEGVNGDELPMVKFAESIVRQCGFELVDESLQYNSPLIQEFTMKVANRLKARFGMDTK